MTMRKVGKLAIGLIGITALATGCGGSSKSSSATTAPSGADTTTGATTATSPPTTTVNYGQKYLAIVAPANTTGDTFNAKISALSANGANPATSAVAAAVAPFVTALTNADSKLVSVQWPGQAETDIRALITDDGAMIGDLNALGSANMITGSSVETQLSEDLGKQQAAVSLVRSDLHLPQDTNS